jgi:serine/threonine protein phosphatase PrpC
MEQLIAQLVEWASASRPLVADQESGDADWVRAFPDAALIAVVDGLGHGAEAAAVARRAIGLLAAANGEPPLAALRRCHEGLRSTRGVVMSVAGFEAGRGTMTWTGVGNVAGVLLHPMTGARPHQTVLRPCRGVVGRHLPSLHAETLSVSPGDTLVFATDGIDERFMADLEVPESLQEGADRILAAFGGAADDALVVMARYRGAAS